MNRMISCLAALGAFASSGCLSTHLVKQKATAHLEYHTEDQEIKQVAGQPGYYALLPLTVAGDVVTLPFQMVFLMNPSGSKGSGAVIVDGWPIPIP